MTAPMITAAKDQVAAKERQEAQLRAQADRLLAEHYRRRARFGRVLADRGMSWCGRLLLVGVVIGAVGIAMMTFGQRSAGLAVTFGATGVEVVAVVLMLIYGQWGSRYTGLRQVVSRVIQFRGAAVADALLSEYPRPKISEMEALIWELPRVRPAD